MKRILFFFLTIFIFRGSFVSSQEITPEEIFSNFKDAVVVIRAIDFDGNESSQGSGVIIKDKGILVTNFHIFAGNDKLVIKQNDIPVAYNEIIGLDIEKDILIIGLETTNFPSIKPANINDIKVGQKVFAIGSPMGLENTMSEGIVSGIRTLEDGKQEFIQFTASLSPGSSGGALLNSNGELIGISTMYLKKGQNLNFAVSIKDIEGITLGEYSDKIKLQALNHFFRGRNLHDEGRYSDAIKYYDKYISIFPNDAKAYNFRGLSFQGKKDFENAIKDLSKAIKLDPNYIAAISNRGECYFKMEKWDEAQKDFSKVLKIEPDNVSMYFNRGLAYSKEEDWDEAIDDFTKVIKANSMYTEAYMNRGLAYYYASNYELAIIDWKKCIKLDPSLTNTLNKLIDNADLLWQHNIK
ncbi:MAG TPA: tetratricopeptide repeat protein [Ignavibacteria bacterium]|nr:tetratricopeptide repeat protein [Ignavibacteria bacterium]HRK00317.1 tetratricopeptide repeat protein [Ignavibacteria bacterium]